MSSNKSLAMREELSRADPGNHQLRLALASIHQQISDILSFLGNSAGALEHSGKALSIYEGLARGLANDPEYQTQLVIQTYSHANLLKATEDIDGAAAEYRRAVELSGRFIAAHPSDTAAKIHLATSLDGLGNVLQDKGDTAGALDNRRMGLMIREELCASNPDNAHYRRQTRLFPSQCRALSCGGGRPVICTGADPPRTQLV